jgi:hypothetical protein
VDIGERLESSLECLTNQHQIATEQQAALLYFLENLPMPAVAYAALGAAQHVQAAKMPSAGAKFPLNQDGCVTWPCA